MVRVGFGTRLMGFYRFPLGLSGCLQGLSSKFECIRNVPLSGSEIVLLSGVSKMKDHPLNGSEMNECSP